ncbi:hypothetical protein LTR56_012468 [Elasticomyces elasticus]|nr:hypothetical protein LTR56_012468 [Elasticomyces elasticus]KAK3647641.1 hypothetical protein LTR22_013697 [Elasticomyces elasticus]KAK4906683.1 hypothetical protein LTR49_024196 [Elasticomyces elasticus]KAK5763716.1 hypothetical protein LTS12_006048 [Elasticomyces elasticus]
MRAFARSPAAAMLLVSKVDRSWTRRAAVYAQLRLSSSKRAGEGRTTSLPSHFNHHPRANLALDRVHSNNAPGQAFGLPASPFAQSVPHRTSLTPEGCSLRDRLSMKQENPTLVLKELVEQGKATTETLRLCLEEHFSRLSKHPRKARIQLIQKDGIGTLILQWLWQDNTRWVLTLDEDILLFEKLVYYLLGENMQQYVLDWIKADIPANAAHHFTRKNRNRWRGALLRTLVAAHTVLECNGSANAALKVYFRIADDILALRASKTAAGKGCDGYAATSLWPAEVALGKALYSGKFPQTDSRLFNRFMSVVSPSNKNVSKTPMVLYNLAKLWLLHPSEPDPGPMLSMLQQYYSNDVDESGYPILTRMVASGTAARVNLLFTMVEVEHLLRSQARVVDADWVAEKHEALLSGSDDKTRQLYRYHDASPEVARRRRQEERRLASLVEARVEIDTEKT